MRIGIVSLITLNVAIQLFSILPARSQAIEEVAIKLELKNESLIKAFRKIEAKSPFHFMYSKADVKDIRNLNIPLTKQSVAAFLETLLYNTSLDYRQLDNRILIMASGHDKNQPGKEILYDSQKQLNRIEGKVFDSQGNLMHGVNILLKGASIHTQMTDTLGNYSFTNLPAGTYTLTFTFLGFATSVNNILLKEGEQIVFNPFLSEETRVLDEVVVVAYGTQKKTSLTSSVTSIQGDAIVNLPVPNISNSLGGRVSGLITRQTSGEPGKDGAAMYVRGISSNGGTQPLLIVDGIPRSFGQLDPEIIETITVLKDAAAAAPYGVAGANGVILVTTKVGNSGAPSLSFSSSYGLSNITAIPDLPTSHEFALLRNAASINDGTTPFYTPEKLEKLKNGSDPDRYPNTNAHDIMIDRNTPQISNTLQVSGGAEKIRYYASIGNMFHQGMFKPLKSDRYTLTLNMDAEVTKSTTISLKLNTRQQTNSYAGVITSELFPALNYVHPTMPIFWSNGKVAHYVYGTIHESGFNVERGSQIFSQLSVDQKLSFIPGLSFKGQIAYDPSFIFTKVWIKPFSVWNADFNTTPYTFTEAIFGNNKASLTQTYSNPRRLTYQSSLNYSRTFGKSDVSALALFEASSANSMEFSAGRINYSLLVDELSAGSSAAADLSNSGNSSQSSQMGLVYRLNYAYAGKYLLEASGRYDGHYYFAPGKKYGFFPAVSLGWRLSEENFIKKNLLFVNNLKITGSYGELGALAGIPFQYLSTYGVFSNTVALGGSSVLGVAERNEANRNITWETERSYNAALEASLWKSMVTITAEYFSERRNNMLVNPSVITPQEYGIGLSQVNEGKMKNHGFELSLGTKYRVSKDLQLSFSSNITSTKNTVLHFFEPASTFNNPNRRQTGRPLGTQFGYKADGFYLPEDFTPAGALKPDVVTGPSGTKLYPGDLKYRDINGDLRINNDDIVPIGEAQVPRVIYGLNPNIVYKSFHLDILFQGADKMSRYLSEWAVWPFVIGRGAYKHNLDYWRPDNLNARNPRITHAPQVNNTQISSWWMNNAGYLRLKSAQLAYRLPANLIQKAGIRSATLHVAAQNLKTWTKMKYDYDPENSTVLGAYPSEQVISMGINVTFK